MGWTRRAVGAGLFAAAAMKADARSARPLVIAHRGASGDRPEHTLSAYKLAIEQGADFIEPDLVVTRDGQLVCRHENEISGTTDVADRPEFAARRTAKPIDGVLVEGWFVEDFDLAELKTLRCRERIPTIRPANTAFDGQDAVPTFAEAVALARSAGRTVGVYPEMKHPAALAAAGHDVVALMAEQLKALRLDARDAPVFVQCFETEPLQRLRRVSNVRLIQLVAATGGPYDRVVAGRPISYSEMLAPDALRNMRAYADGIGPDKILIVPRAADGRSSVVTSLVRDAHAAGLQVHAWTCRSENIFLPTELRSGDDPAARGDAAAEYAALFAAGVDGVFSDHPADAVAARNRLAPARL